MLSCIWHSSLPLSTTLLPLPNPRDLGCRVYGLVFIKLRQEFEIINKQGHIHDTLSRGGWAGAVMWWAVGSALNTTTSVTGHWAGAVMQKLLAKCQKSKGRTDRQTDRSTDTVTYRVAYPATNKDTQTGIRCGGWAGAGCKNYLYHCKKARKIRIQTKF